MLIQRNKQFLTRLWALENDGRPGYSTGYVGPRVKNGKSVSDTSASDTSASGEQGDAVRDLLLSAPTYLRAQLDAIDAQLALRGDFVPTLSPSIGSVGIPSAFGCELVWQANDLPTVRPLLGDDPDAIFALQTPSVIDGELGRMLDYTAYFIEQTTGRYPIRICDVQGPLDNAAQIMGHDNLRMAMRTHPRAVHSLLKKITNLIIAFVQAQRDLAMCYGCGFVPSTLQPWLPDGKGISISDEYAALIPAQMHDEFALPYLNQLSEAFGGIFLRASGNWLHQIPSLSRARRLRGVEFGASDVPFQSVLEHFGGKIVLACCVGSNRSRQFDSMTDYVRRVIAAARTYRGLFVNLDVTDGLIDDTWCEANLDEIYALLESPGRAAFSS